MHSPVPLAPEHDLKAFDCGVPMMSDWLHFHARRTQANGSMKTFVVTGDARVVGYFNLTVGQIDTREAPQRVRAGVGRFLPVVNTDRMAVCREYQGHGICKGMLKDAIRRSLLISEQAGLLAMVGYSKSDSRNFWVRFGYIPSPIQEDQVLLLLKDAKKLLA
ncbi:MAG: GNAT family N-acetyltransferase [Gammaproteobacteria bacterium]|nr:GNAT family N-acetyltransferase [Gammaproteobacteria bacterium]